MFLSPTCFDHTPKVKEGINSESWHVIAALDLLLAPKANEASWRGFLIFGSVQLLTVIKCGWLLLWLCLWLLLCYRGPKHKSQIWVRADHTVRQLLWWWCECWSHLLAVDVMMSGVMVVRVQHTSPKSVRAGDTFEYILHYVIVHTFRSNDALRWFVWIYRALMVSNMYFQIIQRQIIIFTGTLG